MGCEVLLKVDVKKESELERIISKLEDELEVKAVRGRDLYAWDGIFGPLIHLSPEKLEVDGTKVTRVTFRLPRSKYVPKDGLIYQEFEDAVYGLLCKAEEVVGKKIGEGKCSVERVLGPWCWGQGVVYKLHGGPEKCTGRTIQYHYEFDD